jgi:hypothetical protein
MTNQFPVPPDALLLMAPGCAHCPLVLESLGRLLKEGRLGRLEVVNVAAHPEAALAAGTRSVPWTRIGPFELDGLYGPAELAGWAGHAAAGTGMGAYLAHLLEHRQLDRAAAVARREAGALAALLGLAGSLETPMGVRIGISAVVEELQDTPALRDALPALAGLTASPGPQVRADAAHYLGLTGSDGARQPLERLLADPDPQVREIAAESLAMLRPPQLPQD